MALGADTLVGAGSWPDGPPPVLPASGGRGRDLAAGAVPEEHDEQRQGGGAGQ